VAASLIATEPAANDAALERINVIGTSGSGKTTFARELARLLGLPCHEMDALFWKPDWRESSDEELLRKVEDVTSGPRWVLDGSYTRTRAVSWRRVQVVIWLDPSFMTTLWSVTARTVRRACTREELWAGTGNRESLAQAFFTRKSIIWWAISRHEHNRRKYSAATVAPEYAHIRFVRLGSRSDAARFLNAIARGRG
jgi:adenylate kinase family enzyme